MCRRCAGSPQPPRCVRGHRQWRCLARARRRRKCRCRSHFGSVPSVRTRSSPASSERQSCGRSKTVPGTFGDLLLNLPSIYTTEALAAIGRIPRLPGVDVEVLGQIRADASVRPQGRAGGGSLLPLPHPLDFEWRFSDETCRKLLAAASEMTRRGETILLYGTPGLAYAAVLLPVRHRRVVFVGADNAVTRRMRALNTMAGRPISVVVGEGVQRKCASVVVVDPPWYPDYLKPLLRSAAEACRSDGVVLASLASARDPTWGLPGSGMHSSCSPERLGLDRVDVEELTISYETPFFEENALTAVGIYVPAIWRRGDLVVYKRRKAAGDQSAVPDSPRESWVEVEIDGMRIRIRVNPGASAAKEGLHSLVRGDVLPSVSRRDPRRAEANVWTSGNRIYRAGDPTATLEAAYACSGRPDGRSGPFTPTQPPRGGCLRRLGGPAAEDRVS